MIKFSDHDFIHKSERQEIIKTGARPVSIEKLEIFREPPPTMESPLEILSRAAGMVTSSKRKFEEGEEQEEDQPLDFR